MTDCRFHHNDCPELPCDMTTARPVSEVVAEARAILARYEHEEPDHAARYMTVCNLLEAFRAGIFDLDEALEWNVTSPQARAFANKVFDVVLGS